MRVVAKYRLSLLILAGASGLFLLGMIGTRRPKGPPRPPAPRAQFEVVGRQGPSAFVWIEPQFAQSSAALREVIAAIKYEGKAVNVMFWSDRSMVPSRLPMTDRQSDSQVAHYWRGTLSIGDREVAVP